MAGCGEDDLHLPQEICSEILTRVPVKSILRFRSVCKSWHSLISCPNFKPKTLSDRVLVNFKDDYVSQGLSSFSESHNLRDGLPDRFRGQRIGLIGSCNGLICLNYISRDVAIEKIYYSLFIYNPAIRKTVELPTLSFISYDHYPLYYGFGFDSKAGDYKAFLIMKDEFDSKGFMFELRTGVWREFTPTIPNFLRKPGYKLQEFYLNDAVYWRGWCSTGRITWDNKHEAIMSFNLSDEKFQVIPMPAKFNFNCRITTFRGLIFALADPYSVWEMKEYGVSESWTKVFNNIDFPLRFQKCSSYELIVRGPEVFEVLLRYRPGMEHAKRHKPAELLILLNIKSGESKRLLSTHELIENLVFYKESLVLL